MSFSRAYRIGPPGFPFPSERMTDEAIAAKREEMGLNDPILKQFANYMSKVLRGDFGKGTSLYNGAPIKTVLNKALKNSFMIGGTHFVFGTDDEVKAFLG